MKPPSRLASSGAALVAAAALALIAPASGLAASSLRFFGNGVDDIDRVKIAIDDPATAVPGPPADVGATDFTIEFWLRAVPGENPAPAIDCGVGLAWIYGNIVIDRDRYNQDRKFGLSLAAGRCVFGVSGDGTGDLAICGTRDLRDGDWHHVAVQRRRSDGWMGLFVDGQLEADGDGPDGDVSYPDDGVPGNFCGGPCVNSDPYLVLAAEKHDAGPTYPSFSGWLDELRISSSLRYAGAFVPPSAPFTPDAGTVALYHFDEGQGTALIDGSGAAGGPSDGLLRFGGSPAGPVWSADRFAPTTHVEPDAFTASFVAAPNPAHARVWFSGPPPSTRAIDVYDVGGRHVATIRRPVGGGAWGWDLRDLDGRRTVPGVYFARAQPDHGSGVRVIVR